MATIIQTVDGVVTSKFDLSDTALTFGRTTDNQVQIDDLAVSNEHARIIRVSSDKNKIAYCLEDLDSTNGTFINEVKIKKQQLHHKDTIRIGWNIFTFLDENEVNFEKTSKIKKSWIPGIYYTK